MPFSPLKFQIPLAAGGIALMAFNFFQHVIPHGKGLVTLDDFLQTGLTPTQYYFYLPLIGLMLLFTIINLSSAIAYLRQLIRWLGNRAAFLEFMAGPPTVAVGLFVPVASLAMTALVFFAPLVFFIPQMSSKMQTLMAPGFGFFGILWIILFWLEFRALKTWLGRPLDSSKLNFVWLLDVFSFGLVSLYGTGITALSDNPAVVSIAAIASIFSLVFGFLLLIGKLTYLLYLQMKADSLPGNNILPAFFILIPISCLYGFSFYRIGIFLKASFQLDLSLFLFVSLVFPYVISILWGLFCLYLLGGYFRKVFWGAEFAPPQWSMV
ncbi:MAG: hypothetical protein AB1585_16000 [Thermodesulfobacteriota bacterium]